jgi:hypothetical protein
MNGPSQFAWVPGRASVDIRKLDSQTLTQNFKSLYGKKTRLVSGHKTYGLNTYAPGDPHKLRRMKGRVPAGSEAPSAPATTAAASAAPTEH